MRDTFMVILAVAVLLASATADSYQDSYQEAYVDSRGPSDTQSVKLTDRSPSAVSATASPGVVYGAPVVSQPSPAPVYGVPIRQQYGPPMVSGGAQYAAPFPMYGAPTSVPTGPPGPIFAPDQGVPFNIDILGFLSSIPLPDVHSVLKLLFKITVLKAVIKVISIFFLLFFAPKFGDILNLIGMITNVSGDSSSHEPDADSSTMNETPEEESNSAETTTRKPSLYRLRAAKEMRLDEMARQLHESINKTARQLSCQGESCGFGSHTDVRNMTATGLITRMLHTLTGNSDSKKKSASKNVKKSSKPASVS